MYQKINRVLICIFLLQLMILLPQNTMAQKIKNPDNITLVGNKNCKVNFLQNIKRSPFPISDSSLLTDSFSLGSVVTISKNEDSDKNFDLTKIRNNYETDLKRFYVNEIAFDEEIKNIVMHDVRKPNKKFNLTKFKVVGDFDSYDLNKKILIKDKNDKYYLIYKNYFEELKDEYQTIERYKARANTIDEKLPKYLVYVERLNVRERKLIDESLIEIPEINNSFYLFNSEEEAQENIKYHSTDEKAIVKKIPAQIAFSYDVYNDHYEIDAIPNRDILFYFMNENYEELIDTTILPNDYYNMYENKDRYAYNLDLNISQKELTLDYWLTQVNKKYTNENNNLWFSKPLIPADQLPFTHEELNELPIGGWETQINMKNNTVMSYSVDNLVKYIAYTALNKMKLMKIRIENKKKKNAKVSQNKKDIEKARRKYGSKYVNAALKGDIIVGMPEDLLPIPLKVWSIKSRDNFANGYKLWCRFTLDNSRKLLIVVQNGKVSRVSNW